jgi:peptidoglycan hydrolase CwlO-like protein
VNKKLMIIVAVAGLVSFAGAFATGWLTRPAAVMGSTPPAQAAAANPALSPGQIPPPTLTPTATAADDTARARSMTEQQLNDLIYEVRQKIEAYNQKVQDLEKEKERLQIAQQTLKKDIDTLNSLRVDLATSVANLKNERDMLLKTRVSVEQVEKSNLVAIAAAYDKMDPVGASDILTSMALGQSRTGGRGNQSANIDDAVKILHFMQDRTKAKVLTEIVAKDPPLAALLCQKLKQVQEGK